MTIVQKSMLDRGGDIYFFEIGISDLLILCPYIAMILLRLLLAASLHQGVRSFWSLCMLGVCLSAISLSAQSSETYGTIAGRVQNAVTGRYLPNVRVVVEGTTQEAFTDETGSFRLRVGEGARTLTLHYTGLDTLRAVVEVKPGETTERSFSLSNEERYGKEEGVLELDRFVVSSSQLVEGEALAINEQRYAGNIKNVVSTEAFGDITEGNIGEFMKYLPGVTIEYTDSSPDAVSIRGFDPNLSTVSVDGGQLANAVVQGASRKFQFKQVSINDFSRIEVTKVPTPATPADSMAGSVNLVSKSAFERQGRQLKYRAYLIGNSDELTLNETPYPFEENTYKIMPGFDFDYTLPINENLGVVITGMSSSQYSPQDINRTVWRGTTTAGTDVSPSNPYLQSHQVIDAPKYIYRHSLGGKLDWRVTPNSVLSLGARVAYFLDVNGNYSRTINAGTNGNPTPASGTRMTFDENSTHGATGRGAVNMASSFLYIPGVTVSGNARYRFDDGLWMVDAGVSTSKSRTWRKGVDNGHFQAINSQLTTPVRVSFDDVANITPDTIKVYNNGGQEVDIYDIDNYRVTTATQNSRAHVSETITSGDVNIKRQLTSLSFPASIQVGSMMREQTRNIRREQLQWTHVGSGGNQAAAPYAARIFSNQPNEFGFDNIPWVSPHIAVDAWMRDPSLFTKTTAQMINEEAYRRRGSEYIEEVVSAGYVQLDMKFFENKLRVLTGVRYEKTTDDGLGPLEEPSAVYQRNADGSFVRDTNGDRVRRPEAGAPGSMEELQLTLAERGFRAKRSYDGYYPSVHLTYNFRENLLMRLSYAQTYGRPDFDSVIPNSIINEFDLDDGDAGDPNAIGGSITVRNTALRPWSADNYDFSLEYYTEQGGMFTVGAFLKEIEDFFGDVAKQATLEDLEELGLDPRYVGWTLRTKFNSGDARVSGVELSAKHSLAPLGEWGRHFDVFANATKLRLEGNQGASFSQFMPKSANWGITFTYKPVTIMAKWNYRGEQRLLPVTTLGADAYNYFAPRTTMDLNVTYQISERMSFFANARNLTNEPYVSYRYGSETPDYAKQWSYNKYGTFLTLGIKGQF